MIGLATKAITGKISFFSPLSPFHKKQNFFLFPGNERMVYSALLMLHLVLNRVTRWGEISSIG
jgi:hypothetical protein